ncbi:hypothetical protein R3P38DRAFT_3476681 [Favolaschia claudopus]|uniref:Uncharacterized protein n=1 Tax=Favolaschia claudopus TaxID=2862362 RepID=A0AAV9ZBH0_9AGAR
MVFISTYSHGDSGFEFKSIVSVPNCGLSSTEDKDISVRFYLHRSKQGFERLNDLANDELSQWHFHKSLYARFEYLRVYQAKFKGANYFVQPEKVNKRGGRILSFAVDGLNDDGPLWDNFPGLLGVGFKLERGGRNITCRLIGAEAEARDESDGEEEQVTGVRVASRPGQSKSNASESELKSIIRIEMIGRDSSRLEWDALFRDRSRQKRFGGGRENQGSGDCRYTDDGGVGIGFQTTTTDSLSEKHASHHRTSYWRLEDDEGEKIHDHGIPLSWYKPPGCLLVPRALKNDEAGEIDDGHSPPTLRPLHPSHPPCTPPYHSSSPPLHLFPLTFTQRRLRKSFSTPASFKLRQPTVRESVYIPPCAPTHTIAFVPHLTTTRSSGSLCRATCSLRSIRNLPLHRLPRRRPPPRANSFCHSSSIPGIEFALSSTITACPTFASSPRETVISPPAFLPHIQYESPPDPPTQSSTSFEPESPSTSPHPTTSPPSYAPRTPRTSRPGSSPDQIGQGRGETVMLCEGKGCRASLHREEEVEESGKGRGRTRWAVVVGRGRRIGWGRESTWGLGNGAKELSFGGAARAGVCLLLRPPNGGTEWRRGYREVCSRAVRFFLFVCLLVNVSGGVGVDERESELESSLALEVRVLVAVCPRRRREEGMSHGGEAQCRCRRRRRDLPSYSGSYDAAHHWHTNTRQRYPPQALESRIVLVVRRRLSSVVGGEASGCSVDFGRRSFAVWREEVRWCGETRGEERRGFRDGVGLRDLISGISERTDERARYASQALEAHVPVVWQRQLGWRWWWQVGRALGMGKGANKRVVCCCLLLFLLRADVDSHTDNRPRYTFHLSGRREVVAVGSSSGGEVVLSDFVMRSKRAKRTSPPAPLIHVTGGVKLVSRAGSEQVGDSAPQTVHLSGFGRRKFALVAQRRKSAVCAVMLPEKEVERVERNLRKRRDNLRRAQPRAAVRVWGGKPQPSGPVPAKVPPSI